MNRQKIIEDIVEFCSKHTKIEQNKKHQLLQKLFKMQDAELAVFLLYQTKKLFGQNQILLNQSYDMIYQLVSDKLQSKQQMLEIYNKYCVNHIGKNLMSITQNHRLIETTIKQVCDLFNQNNIDYYIVGALALYLKAGKLERYHDDIDFMVNENQLPQIKQILQQTDFVFFDNRFDNNKTLSTDGGHTQGEHEVIAWHKTSEFHLGFFLFERQNFCVTNVSYFSEIKNDKKQILVLKNQHPKQKSQYIYGDYFVQVFGTMFRTTLPECVYLIKSSTKDFAHRFKDQIDVDFFEENNLICQQNLNKLILLNQKQPTQNFIKYID